MHCSLVAPVDLKIEVLSKTSLKLTAIPSNNSGGKYFIAEFHTPQLEGYCGLVWYNNPQDACIFKGLTPGKEYTFAYFLGADPGGLDIFSETRIKSFSLPF